MEKAELQDHLGEFVEVVGPYGGSTYRGWLLSVEDGRPDPDDPWVTFGYPRNYMGAPGSRITSIELHAPAVNYEPIEVSGRTMWVCGECGSLIALRPEHDETHTRR
jgi:hypothetical protein